MPRLGYTNRQHKSKLTRQVSAARRSIQDALKWTRQGECETALAALSIGFSEMGEAVAHGKAAEGDSFTSSRTFLKLRGDLADARTQFRYKCVKKLGAWTKPGEDWSVRVRR